MDWQSVSQVTIKGSNMQKAAAAAFKAEMEKKLAAMPGLAEKSMSAFPKCPRSVRTVCMSYTCIEADDSLWGPQ